MIETLETENRLLTETKENHANNKDANDKKNNDNEINSSNNLEINLEKADLSDLNKSQELSNEEKKQDQMKSSSKKPSSNKFYVTEQSEKEEPHGKSKFTKKKFTIINEENNSGDENALHKKNTMRKIEEIKPQTNNNRITKLNSGINKKPKYSLKINTSEEQVISPHQSFFMVDKSFDLNSISSFNTKPKSVIPQINRLPTIDALLTEKIIKGNFDDIFDDPKMEKLLGKINIKSNNVTEDLQNIKKIKKEDKISSKIENAEGKEKELEFDNI